MKEASRIHNSTKNIFFGIGTQSLILLLTFIVRIIFIRILGAEYLGINGLFSNILTVLSLADLGIGNAINYSLYKPLSERNEEKISQLMSFYKKVYNIVAIGVTVVGIVLLFFLDVLVKTDKPIENLQLYFILFLANSVVSYLLANRSAILIADQKLYITKIYNLIFTILQFILQTIVLVTTHNFILYLVIQIISTLGINIAGAIITKKIYPYIDYNKQLDKKTKKQILENMKSMFFYKLGGVILNNTDNILISIICGTIWVGYYSNYTMIINSITTFISIIFIAINASIGNHNVTKGKDEQNKIFNVLNMICNAIFGFCSICLFVLINDFITLVFGANYVLNIPITITIILNFYIVGILNPVWSYRDTTGWFRQTKYIATITAIVNIILSIIMGKIMGILGILLATAISRLLINVWYEPYILIKKYFKTSIKKYILMQFKNLLLFMIALLLIYGINIVFDFSISWINLIIKLILCTFSTIIIFILGNKNTEEYKYIQDRFLIKIKDKIVKKIRREDNHK